MIWEQYVVDGHTDLIQVKIYFSSFYNLTQLFCVFDTQVDLCIVRP